MDNKSAEAKEYYLIRVNPDGKLGLVLITEYQANQKTLMALLGTDCVSVQNAYGLNRYMLKSCFDFYDYLLVTNETGSGKNPSACGLSGELPVYGAALVGSRRRHTGDPDGVYGLEEEEAKMLCIAISIGKKEEKI